ncbi:MAG TPA: amidohydrolase family protein [Gemmatimonadales bacterium]
MRVIDFHNHYYPPAYIDALRHDGGPITVTDDADGNPVLRSPGDANIAVPGHRDITYRLGVLDDAGVDMQVLSFTAPGTLLHPPAQSVTYAKQINDALAAIVRERGDRFTALATLPLNDPAACVSELERAIEELGLPGAMPFSNANGLALSDAAFDPLYRRADALGAVLYIHPTFPVGVEALEHYWLMPLVGFTFDTTLAAASLVFSGVAERYPNIRWVLAHLGGAIPYLAERLDRGYRAFRACRAHIDRPPSEYLRNFYYDTVNFDVRALRLALEFAGADHLLAGSDYPHQIGSLAEMMRSIRALGLEDADEEAVLGGNAARLVGLG